MVSMLSRIGSEFVTNRITWLYMLLSFARYFGRIKGLEKQRKTDSHVTLLILITIAWLVEKYVYETEMRRKRGGLFPDGVDDKNDD